MAQPITKIWSMILKPTTSIDDPHFRQLWTEILQFCNSSAGPISSGHHLWQSLSTPKELTMISGYPSLESNEMADKQYVEKGLMKKMFEMVEHKALWMTEMDVNHLQVGERLLSLEIWPDQQRVGVDHRGETARDISGQVEVTGVRLEQGQAVEQVVLRFGELKDGMQAPADGTRPSDGSKMHLKKILD